MFFSSSKKEKCYCAFCKHERYIFRKKHINGVNFLICSILSLGLSFTIWQDVHLISSVFLILCLSLTEIFIQVRWRLFISCSFCGFDPVLYKKDPESVAQKVKLILETKRDKPETLLSKKNPLLNLPVLKVKAKESKFSKRI